MSQTSDAIDELDSPQRLLETVGSFWANVYQGSAAVSSYLHASAQIAAQSYLNFVELLAAVSRFKVPLFHTDNWYLLTLRESDRNTAEANRYRFGSALTFGDTVEFGDNASTVFHVWTAPATLVDARVMLNRITASSLVLTQSIDYFFENGAIWFRENPFDNDLISKRPVISSGVVVDRECALWIYRGSWDKKTMAEQFGYVVELNLASSPQASQLVNAVYDGIVEGSTQRCIQAAVSAICDVPLAFGNETVEGVWNDNRSRWIVTDKQAYRSDLESTPLVAAGDVLSPGDPLTDAVQFFEFGRGEVPDAIKAISIQPGFLAHGYFGELTFENEPTELYVAMEDTDGYTKVSFDIGGFPGDVEAFWAAVHASGVAQGQTLAMLLDTRPEAARDEKPGPLALPKTINPLSFLIEHVFRANLFVLLLKPASFGGNQLGLEHLRILRKLIPPGSACIVLVQLEITGDEITMDGDGTETAAGYAEKVTLFSAQTASDDITPNDYVEEEISVRPVGGHYA